jgi:hypothetical protein
VRAIGNQACDLRLVGQCLNQLRYRVPLITIIFVVIVDDDVVVGVTWVIQYTFISKEVTFSV